MKSSFSGVMAVIFLAAPWGGAFAEDRTKPTLEEGRALTEQFLAGDLQGIWDSMSPDMQAAFQQFEGLQTFQAQVAPQLGAETRLMSERAEEIGGYWTYFRTSRYAGAPKPIDITWSFDDSWIIAGFYVRPSPEAAPTDFLDYETQTELRLPFEDEWFVFWGGRTVDQNYHVVARDQRFAYDLLVVQDGSSHRGEGSNNEDYYCFGRPVLAPGAGTVVGSASDVPDNVPGELNPDQALGNYVIIDHGNSEFSFLAHFKQGSVKVSEGDAVRAGDLLGECGNSGNTSEAHIHYHLQNTAVFGGGEGLPAKFNHYMADGSPVERGEPTRGQTVAPAPSD